MNLNLNLNQSILMKIILMVDKLATAKSPVVPLAGQIVHLHCVITANGKIPKNS